MNQILEKAIKKYGLKHQSMMAIEEMAELQKELCKYQRYANNVQSIAEEIADVEIMLEQLKELYNCRSYVELFKEAKIKRLDERMQNE